jgi:tetratricopeptide (TPR) repeat protein
MKSFILISLLMSFLIACSSSKRSGGDVDVEKVSNEAFKKDKPLLFGAGNDYYSSNLQVESPGLQDETIDRLTKDDLDKIDAKGDELLSLAISCAKKEREESARLIDKLYQKYQNYPSYWTQVANCYLKQGEQRKALLYYNKALEVSSSYTPALNNIGVLYYQQGQHQKALVAFERANNSSKFSKTPRLNLARIYLTYGLADQALPVISGLVNQSPNDNDLIVTLGNVYFLKGNYQEALKQFFRLDQKLWASADIGLNVSYSLYKIGKKKDAANVLDKIDKPKEASLKNYYNEMQSLIGE